MRTMAVLGATGSIGSQALDLARRYPNEYRITALTAGSSANKLFDLVREFRPVAAGLVNEPKSIPEDLRFCEWFFGEDCSSGALSAAKPDDALAAVVGIAGLGAVMTALDVCKRVLLANKEALVTGGELVMARAREKNVPLLPVDSEHSAIFQCLQGAGGNVPARLILTASGGPFRNWEKEEIGRATVEQALGHPTWRMGAKITVDCASMMNKGLEVIEAHHLFSMPGDVIDVIVHPQSVIHSMVEYADGAILSQMGAPDMRAAIGYAMGYPSRLPFGGRRLNFAEIGALTFEKPDTGKFPCLQLAYEALKAGGGMPTALNGANEAAVNAFLARKIPFGRIERCVHGVLSQIETRSIRSVSDVYAVDREARAMAKQFLKG